MCEHGNDWRDQASSFGSSTDGLVLRCCGSWFSCYDYRWEESVRASWFDSRPPDWSVYSYMMFTCVFLVLSKKCAMNFRQRHANEDWSLYFTVACPPHLELSDILKHHVHVIVETTQSADKLFVTLQNDPDLRSCHRKIPVLYDLFAVRQNTSPETILKTAMGPCKRVHSAQHDRTGRRHHHAKQK